MKGHSFAIDFDLFIQKVYTTNGSVLGWGKSGWMTVLVGSQLADDGGGVHCLFCDGVYLEKDKFIGHDAAGHLQKEKLDQLGMTNDCGRTHPKQKFACHVEESHARQRDYLR